MTLDKAERDRREEQVGVHAEPPGQVYRWLREAHARIEELEFSLRYLEGEMVGLEDICEDAENRAEGWRQAAIILRDWIRNDEAGGCMEPGCRALTRRRYARCGERFCYRHRHHR